MFAHPQKILDALYSKMNFFGDQNLMSFDLAVMNAPTEAA